MKWFYDISSSSWMSWVFILTSGFTNRVPDGLIACLSSALQPANLGFNTSGFYPFELPSWASFSLLSRWFEKSAL